MSQRFVICHIFKSNHEIFQLESQSNC